MKRYLASTEYINWQDARVLAQARTLAEGAPNSNDIIHNCFNFVRDEIKHSWDYKLNPVTNKASDVLKYGTGYCYAKSHLLAALLRANDIPAGLCYQRLTISDVPPFCLHGLNAVYLDNIGWHRIDARGNNGRVATQFSPPIESLAYTATTSGEFDLPEIYSEPLPVVIDALQQHSTYQALSAKLPDIKPYRLKLN